MSLTVNRIALAAIAALAAMLGIFVIKKKQIELTKKRVAIYCVLHVLAALVLCSMIMPHVSPIYDTVVLTATGEKNTDAKGVEVFLKGYTIDGVAYTALDSLQIEDGHWFWNGDSYCWRIETDNRQPDGVTRSVTIQIPVGQKRTLDFNGNAWRGMVEISTEQGVQTIDTYSETSKIISAELPQSDSTMLMLNHGKQLLVFAVVMAVASILLTMLSVVCWKDEQKRKAWISKNWFYVTIGLISLGQFLFAVYYSGVDGFWLDELYEISASVNASSLLDRAFTFQTGQYMFGTIIGIWYKIAPYGEKWLLLPFELITAIGVFFIGLSGKELKNEFVGVISAIAAAVSKVVLVQCSYEIRSYPFYFAMAAVVLYFFLRHIRRRQQEGWGAVIGYGLCLSFFAGMHYHAVICCIVLCLIDFMFLLCCDRTEKKYVFRMMVPYVIAALLFVPNLVYVLVKDTVDSLNLARTWMDEPVYAEVIEQLQYFGNGFNILVFIFVIGFGVSIAHMWEQLCRNKEKRDIYMLRMVAPALWLILMFVCFLVWGKYRIANGQSSLWVNRYFLGLYPAFFVLLGLGFDALKNLIVTFFDGTTYKRQITSVFLCLLLIMSNFTTLHSSANAIRQPWRESADWLYEQGKYIYKDDTLVLVTHSIIPGWEDYYLTRQGRRDSINVKHQSDISAAELKNYERIYVVYIYSPNSKVQTVLDKDYKLESTNSSAKVKVYVRK